MIFCNVFVYLWLLRYCHYLKKSCSLSRHYRVIARTVGSTGNLSGEAGVNRKFRQAAHSFNAFFAVSYWFYQTSSSLKIWFPLAHSHEKQLKAMYMHCKNTVDTTSFHYIRLTELLPFNLCILEIKSSAVTIVSFTLIGQNFSTSECRPTMQFHTLLMAFSRSRENLAAASKNHSLGHASRLTPRSKVLTNV